MEMDELMQFPIVAADLMVDLQKLKTRMSKLRPILIAISGPSGSGKSTLVSKLIKDYPNKFGFGVSHTTRKPRPGEVDGKDYYFTNKNCMTAQIENGEFIETSVFSNNMYGTSKKAVKDLMKTGRVCVMDLDLQGIKSMRKSDLDCLRIFIKPPSVSELEKRLRCRGTQSEESIARRLATCEGAMKYAEQPGSYHHTIVNDEVEIAYDELKTILEENMNLNEAFKE